MIKILPKIIRVTGQSMSPYYKDGDYVVIYSMFLKLMLQENRDIVFKHQRLGLLIKRISRVNFAKKTVSVFGTGYGSSSTQKIGDVEFQNIIGYVIFKV